MTPAAASRIAATALDGDTRRDQVRRDALTDGRATERTAREGEVAAAMTTVSAALGNTRAVCRRCYVHPLIVEAYLDGTLQERARRPMARVTELRHVGAAVLSLLRRARTRTKRAAASAAA